MLWISPPVEAQARRKSGWIAAQIFVDGAAIYEKPDFDSKVQDYLRYQTKVMVSKKAFRGAGGMGLFHRIRYHKKFGYVTDTDIKIDEAVEASIAAEAPEKKSGSKAWEKEEKQAVSKGPLYFRRYLGGAVSMVKFSEKFSGKKFSDDMWMYGMRMMGPGTLFDGPPLDFNFWFSLDKPGYYSKFSKGDPTGFLLFGDTMLNLPLIDAKSTLVTYGLGVMWVYTNYKVPVKNSKFDSQEVRVGLDAGLGVGQKFGAFMLRADAKYYYEKTQYFGYMLSFMGEY